MDLDDRAYLSFHPNDGSIRASKRFRELFHINKDFQVDLETLSFRMKLIMRLPNEVEKHLVEAKDLFEHIHIEFVTSMVVYDGGDGWLYGNLA